MAVTKDDTKICMLLQYFGFSTMGRVFKKNFLLAFGSALLKTTFATKIVLRSSRVMAIFG
jgi:hypothetical protein